MTFNRLAQNVSTYNGRTNHDPPSEDLLDRAKHKAAAEGRTLTSLIEDGLRLIVTEKQGVTSRKRVLPRVSKAGGKAMPGIDFTDSATLQEIEDLDYLGRIKNLK